MSGELGVLVNPENTAEIAEAIVNIFKGRGPKHLLDADIIRKKTIETYGVEKFKERVGALLREVAEQT